VTDTSVSDTSVCDTSVSDTSVSDTSVCDTSVSDTSVCDTSVCDTSVTQCVTETRGQLLTKLSLVELSLLMYIFYAHQEDVKYYDRSQILSMCVTVCDTSVTQC